MSKKNKVIQEDMSTTLAPGTTHADLMPTAHLEQPTIEQKLALEVTEDILAESPAPCVCGKTQAEKDYTTLKEAAKIRQEPTRFMAAQTIGPVPQ